MMVVLFCLAAPASAADSQDERASLAGLKAISIVVEELPPAAAPSGLTTKMLLDDVERRVKAGALRVTPDADAYLYIHITIADAGSSVDEFVDQFIKAYQSVNPQP
jgi:hypothetical protein